MFSLSPTAEAADLIVNHLKRSQNLLKAIPYGVLRNLSSHEERTLICNQIIESSIES
jgi:hypothetical protein